jgi:hypothetical protein
MAELCANLSLAKYSIASDASKQQDCGTMQALQAMQVGSYLSR